MSNAESAVLRARQQLTQLILGYGVTQAIACIAYLEIADKLADGPKTVDQLAQATLSSPPCLGRLMRTLCTLGLFSESEAGFQLTQMSMHLRTDAPDSLLPLAKIHADEMYTAFGGLLENVRTGVPAWDSRMGRPVWNYFRENLERGKLFDETMRLNHIHDLQSMVDAYDFSTIEAVSDIGGGEGSLLRAILTRHMSIKGLLMDLPEVISRALASEVWKELAPRCSFVPGDFFAEVPKGSDLYILRHILHDWNDDHCVKILAQCRKSMHASSRVLVIEALLDSPTQHGIASWLDLNMMVVGGRERTAKQYEELLAAAGLAMTHVKSITRATLIEARGV